MTTGSAWGPKCVRTAAIAGSRKGSGREVLAIGSGFDAFIKPTLGGFERIDDFAKLRDHLDDLCPEGG